MASPLTDKNNKTDSKPRLHAILRRLKLDDGVNDAITGQRVER